MKVALDWTLTYGGHAWTFAELTGAEVADLAVLLGDDWQSLDPRSSPVALLAHVAVHVATVEGRDLAAVQGELKATPALQLVKALAP